MWEVQEAVQLAASLHDPQAGAVPGQHALPGHCLTGLQQCVHLRPLHQLCAAEPLLQQAGQALFQARESSAGGFLQAQHQLSY